MNAKRANYLGKTAHKGTRCPVSRKTQHRTKRKALRGSGNRNHGGAALRAYLCPHCGFWHASTKRKEETWT